MLRVCSWIIFEPKTPKSVMGLDSSGTAIAPPPVAATPDRGSAGTGAGASAGAGAPTAPGADEAGSGCGEGGGDPSGHDSGTHPRSRGPCPLLWFATHAPAAVARARAAGYRVYDFVVEAGEVVFIPHGWWHAVLNLTDTVAVTQNFVSRANARRAYEKCVVDEPEVAKLWQPQLQVAGAACDPQ